MNKNPLNLKKNQYQSPKAHFFTPKFNSINYSSNINQEKNKNIKFINYEDENLKLNNNKLQININNNNEDFNVIGGNDNINENFRIDDYQKKN